jgi:methylenetetrahydrofolate dehydrogenase (NADP+) / methenyltetrahydrofolate cyclohydrolase
LGATPQAAMHILDYYELGDVSGSVCLIISQSNLIGKPLTVELMNRGATVICANSQTSKKVLEESFGLATYVFSATGVKHLISQQLEKKFSLEKKILIDI